MAAPNKRAVAKMHVKTGDTVMVISGTESGKVGKVLSAYPKEGKVIVAGVNVVTRHIKPRGAQQPGGRIQQESGIFVSKVMLYCDKCKKPTRIAHAFLEDGKKIRVCKKCGEHIE